MISKGGHILEGLKLSLSEKDLYLRRYLKSKVLGPERIAEVSDFFDYCDSLGSVDHIVRYVETFKRIFKNDLVSPAFEYCETGDLSCVSQYLVEKGYRLTPAKGDFRYEVLQPTNSVDVLLSLEVVEHIKDQDPTCFDEIVLFNYSGIRAYAKECFRILKPDGVLIVTTPNACSLASILNALEYRVPAIYAPHVKEYAPSEIADIFRDAGFRLSTFDTFFSYFHLDDNVQAMGSVFGNLSHSPANRGDTSCFIFKKPIDS